MTHITEARVIGSHADMGPGFDILHAGGRRRVRREETDTALSTWDSEGGR
jgi:homoserine kinase